MQRMRRCWPRNGSDHRRYLTIRCTVNHVPTVHAVSAFAALSFALIVVPGPSVMFIVGRAVALGRRAALWTVIGNSAGAYLQVVLVSLGVGVIVERSMIVFATLKIVGAIYLMWLGVRAFSRPIAQSGSKSTVRTKGFSRIVREGFVVGFTNPKSFVFFAAFLPQFANTEGLPIGFQMALFGLVFTVIAVLCDAIYGLLAGTFRDWFTTSTSRQRWMNRGSGAVMIGLGARLLTTGRAT